MKYFIIISVFLFSCNTSPRIDKQVRNNFSDGEKELIALSKTIMNNCYYTTLITINQKGQAKARVMEPFPMDEKFEIWMATNPKSRKVSEITNNSKTTVHYFDKSTMSYVSFYGNAFIINDEKTKSTKWKKGWERFYKNQKDDYMLIRFIPDKFELISITKGFTGDKNTWKPHVVDLRL